MKSYTEHSFVFTEENPWKEILIAKLLELGFDSFNETNGGLLAYTDQDCTDSQIQSLLEAFPDNTITYKGNSPLPDINWNAEWEKNFEPINIEDKLYLRAEFHPPMPDREEIIIQPKMSFGTGHHATTYLMLKQMMDMDFSGKTVLDMGCGTSVLAIYAKKHGASSVKAIDIDEWSVVNSQENAERNQVQISVEQGTAENLGGEEFDIILANINRNILMEDIPVYHKVLKKEGKLLLSGLCFFDADDIIGICESLELELIRREDREEWVSLLFVKE